MKVTLLLLVISFSTKVHSKRTRDEKWSWGSSRESRHIKSDVIFIENLTKTPIVPESSYSSIEPVVDIPKTRSAKKIDVSVKQKKSAEPRFFGLKKEMCKFGLGFNCGSKYELIEEGYPPYKGPHGQYGHNSLSIPYRAPSLSPHNVLAVQPVALQPVGGPIQAIPLGPSGGAHSTSGIHPYGGGGFGIPHVGGGDYSPPPIYNDYGPPSVSNGYGPPPIHNTPSHSYGAHNVKINLTPDYGPPPQSYGSSPNYDNGASHIPPPSYGVPPNRDGVADSSGGFKNGFNDNFEPFQHFPEPSIKTFNPEPQIVKHIHTHTHIHQSDLSSGLRDASYESSHSSGIGSQFSINQRQRPPRSHILPKFDHIDIQENEILPFYQEDCKCVPNYLCPLENVVGRSSKDRLHRIDARNRKSSILSNATESELKKLKIIRAKKVKRSKRDLSKTTFKVFNDTLSRQVNAQGRIRNVRRIDACRKGEVCCKFNQISGRELSYSCGKRNMAGVLGRVKNAAFDVQEGDTQFGEYPWQAAILKRESDEIIYVCGATLVNDRHVLTAGHCVKGMTPRELKIRLGEWDVNRKTEFYDHVEVDVSKIDLHPQFYSGTLKNDIAVIELSWPVDMKSNPHINPICLPHAQSDFTSSRCYVTGWGKDAFGRDGEFQYLLKEVEVPVWGFRGCQTALQGTRLGRSYELNEGMLCAGGEKGKDACKGDGGGPLACEAPDGSMELAGIVSWGIGCGESGVPGVYVDVAFYMEWITKILLTS